MSFSLLIPPFAFIAYLLLGGLFAIIGKALAGPVHSTAVKSSTYSSGEEPPRRAASPGYRPFFVTALFFAIVHLGVLMFATGNLAPMTGIYLLGLSLALLALILG